MAAPVKVQHNSVDGGNGVATLAATLTGVTAGNSIVALCFNQYGEDITSVDDGTAYGPNGSVYVDGTNAQWSWHYLSNVAGGDHTVTVTYASTAYFPKLVLIEVSGAIVADGAIGNYSASFGTGTDAVTTGDLTTNVPDTLLICALHDYTYLATRTAGTGFTQDTPTTWGGGGYRDLEYGSKATAGAVAGTWTQPSANTVAVVMAAWGNAGGPPQEAYPAADVTDGAWTPSAGTDNFACLDAGTTTWIATNSNTTGRFGLAALSTPVSGTQTVSFQADGSPAKKLIATLIESTGTSRGTLTVDPLVAGTYTFNPSGISNYGDLDIQLEIADATTTPTPSVSFGAIGTGVNGGTSISVGVPTGIVAGNYLLLHVTSGATNSETPSTPSGWTLLATGASTDGTFGIDTGPRRATVFGKLAVGGETAVTVATTNGNTVRGIMSRWVLGHAGYSWDVVGQGANDSTSGTGVSMTTAAIDWAVGDCAAVTVGQRVDSATQSAQSLTASGTTFGTRTNRATTAVTTGNDHRCVIDTFAAVTTGGGSAATTWAYTASAACSAGGVVVRLREVPPTEFGRVYTTRLTIPEAGGAGGAVLEGAAQGLAAASGALTTGIPILGAALVVATASGGLTTGIPLNGVAAAVAAATGSLSSAGAALAGSAAATAAATGQLVTQIRLSGAALAQAVSSALLSTGINMSAAAVSQAAADGTLATAIKLIGAGAAQASASGSLTSGSGLSGGAAAQAGASAALTAQIRLSAAAIAQAAAAAGLTTAIRLGGAASAGASASGALSGGALFAANAAAQATAGAGLTVGVTLSAAALAQAIATGGLTVSIQLAGLAAALSGAAADLSAQIQLGGAAGASASASAELFGEASRPAPMSRYVATLEPRRFEADASPRRFETEATRRLYEVAMQ